MKQGAIIETVCDAQEWYPGFLTPMYDELATFGFVWGSLAVLLSDRKGFSGEPTDLNAPILGLCVELRPVGEACGRRVEEAKLAAWHEVVEVGSSLSGHHVALASPAWVSPSLRSSSSAAASGTVLPKPPLL